MAKAKVLFVAQEIFPFLPESPMSSICRYLPQGVQERSKEIRTFMPRYGVVNERRNQLHEVIRLSGMNLIIDDADHPLIIKVASIQSARMQVYFIDNEDYFQRKFIFRDKDEVFFDDNDERAIFFARGVIETVKKLGWPPDIIHCHGWFSSLVPVHIKRMYNINPLFSDSKVILSVYDEEFPEILDKRLATKLKADGIPEKDVKHYKGAGFVGLMKAAIDFSDALIIASEKINPELERYIHKSGKPVLSYQSPENYINAYTEFYDSILEKETVSL